MRYGMYVVYADGGSGAQCFQIAGAIVGMSSVRRGSATALKAAFAAMSARLILGHTARSHVLEETYDTEQQCLTSPLP